MSLKEALLDLLFPPRCPICSRSSDGETDAGPRLCPVRLRRLVSRGAEGIHDPL